MPVEVSVADLTMIVDEIFGAMAGMPLTACPAVAASDNERPHVVSAVQIVGDWQGAVRLDIDLEMAQRACANFTGVEPEELSQQDVRDAAGELANMVGGSVKALCAHAARLSLPSVAIGRNFEFSFCQGKVIQAQSFSHQCGVLTVAVIERLDPARQGNSTVCDLSHSCL